MRLCLVASVVLVQPLVQAFTFQGVYESLFAQNNAVVDLNEAKPLEVKMNADFDSLNVGIANTGEVEFDNDVNLEADLDNTTDEEIEQNEDQDHDEDLNQNNQLEEEELDGEEEEYIEVDEE